MESEIWKVYKESMYHCKKRVYEVSDLGNVKINGKLVDFSKQNRRYYCIGGFNVHKAVAELFVPNPENKPCIDHINTNKHDNRAVNLRWVTNKENHNNTLTRKYKSEVQNRPEVKAKRSAKLQEYWSNPEARVKQSVVAKEVQNRPEVRAKKSTIQKEVQNRPEVKAKKSAIQKEVQNRPEVKAKKSKAKQELYSDPIERQKQSQRLKGKNKNKRYITNGIDRKCVKQELVDYYLERGYHLGRK